MVEMSRLEMGLALISMLFMLFTTYAMAGMMFSMVATMDNIVLQWITTIAITIVMALAIFGVPIMIALGLRLSILNSILAYIYLMIGIPVAKILGSFIWDLNTAWLITGPAHRIAEHGGQSYLGIMGVTIQLLIIIIILCLIFVIPVLVCTESTTIIIKRAIGGDQ